MKSGGGRPTGGYFNAADTRQPSTTTITGRFKESDGMIYKGKKNWHEAGRRGLPFERDLYWGDSDHPEWGKKDALLIGNIVHQWIEDDLHGRSLTEYPDLPVSALSDARMGYGAYLKWSEGMKPVVIETEVPLVSEEYGFGGTIDAIAFVDGDQVLLDWKTSNRVFRDYISQLAAYRQLVWERGDTEIREAYLLRVGKEYGDFTAHYWPENVLDIGWRWFLQARGLYDIDKELKRVVP